MTIQILFDLHNELQNLMIAGSKYANNNEQLKQHIPTLKDMGKQTPIFTKLATAVEKLTTIKPEETALLLLTINNLLESILQTLGSPTSEIVEKKEFARITPIEELQEDNFDFREAIIAIRLKITSRPGIIKNAYDNGMYTDPRTFPYLALFLDRVFPDDMPDILPKIEVVPFIATKVIPEAGKRLIPFVLNGFEYVDVQRNIHRFITLAELKYEGLAEIRKNIFDRKLPKLQKAYIKYIEPTPENIEELKAFSQSKNKELRVGAYTSLARSEDPEIISYLIDCLLSDSANHEILTELLQGKAVSQTETIKIIEFLETNANSLITYLYGLKGDYYYLRYDEEKSLGLQIGLLHKNEHEEVYSLFQRVINKLYEVNYLDVSYVRPVFRCLLQYNEENVQYFTRKILPEVMAAVVKEPESNLETIGKSSGTIYLGEREDSTRDVAVKMYFYFLFFSMKVLPKEEVREIFAPLLLNKHITFYEIWLGFYTGRELLDSRMKLENLDLKFVEDLCQLFYDQKDEEIGDKNRYGGCDFLDKIQALGEEYKPWLKKILVDRFTYLDKRTPYFVENLVKNVPNWFDVVKVAIENTKAKYGKEMNEDYFHNFVLRWTWSEKWLHDKPIDFAHKFQALADMLDDENQYKSDFLGMARGIEKQHENLEK